MPSDVPQRIAADYTEASLILRDSPKAAAALTRRILADIFAEQGYVGKYKLSNQIDAFLADAIAPTSIKDSLHYLREIGDFGAHSQQDNAGTIIDVEPEEAEFCLDVLDALFEHYYVAPAKAKARMAAFDQKLAQAGRKPLA